MSEGSDAERPGRGGGEQQALGAQGARDLFDPHPLFPRDNDGKPEDRDIKFVGFKRRDPKTGAITTYCEDIPAAEVTSWKQVFGWWGGGHYKAVGKDARHRFQAIFPASAEYYVMEGPTKPFVPRDFVPEVAAEEEVAAPVVARQAALPAAAAPVVPPVPAPTGTEALLIELARELRESRAQQRPAQDPALVELAREVRELRAERNHAPTAPDNTVQVAMINANATLMTTVFKALGGQGDGLDKMVSLVTALKALVPAATAPVAAQGLPEQMTLLKAFKELMTPTAAPPAENGLKTIVDGITGMMAADAQQKTAEAVRGTSSKTVEPPRLRSRPRGELVHVPGLGICDVVVRDVAPAAVPHVAAAPPMPVVVVAPHAVAPPAVVGTPVAADPTGAAVPPAPLAAAVVTVEPPAPVIVDTPPVIAPPAVVVLAPEVPLVPEIVVSRSQAVGTPVTSASPTPGAIEPPAVAVPPPDPPTVAAAPLAEVHAGATSAVEAPATAPLERAPPAEGRAPGESVAEAERSAATRSLEAIGRLARPARVALLQKIPGVGAMAEDIADAVADIPADAAALLIGRICGEDVGTLARMNGMVTS